MEMTAKTGLTVKERVASVGGKAGSGRPLKPLLRRLRN